MERAEKKEEQKSIRGIRPVQMTAVVGNQAVVQMMHHVGAGKRVSKPPKGFTGMLYGADALSAIDEIVGPEIPEWMKAHRPSYATNQVMNVWNRSNPVDNSNGTQTADCVGGADGKVTWRPGTSRVDVWDMGHKPGCEFRRLKSEALAGRMDEDEFNREFKDPSNYQVEDPTHNRSHIDEM